MVKVVFTPNLMRHLDAPAAEVDGATVRAALEAVFADNPRLRDYVLDDQGAVRKHVTVFVDGEQVTDRVALAQAVGPGAEIYVMQALSGG